MQAPKLLFSIGVGAKTLAGLLSVSKTLEGKLEMSYTKTLRAGGRQMENKGNRDEMTVLRERLSE